MKQRLLSLILLLMGCVVAHSEKITDDFTTQVFEWSTSNDHWNIKLEEGCMKIEPTTSKNYGMKLLIGANARHLWASPAAIITSIPGSTPSSFKFGVTFSYRRFDKGVSETGFVFNYYDEDNYSIIALSGKNLVYAVKTEGKIRVMTKKKIKWPKIKKNQDLNWELEYNDHILTFYNNNYPEFKVRNITIDSNEIGIYVNNQQQLTVKEVSLETM